MCFEHALSTYTCVTNALSTQKKLKRMLRSAFLESLMLRSALSRQHMRFKIPYVRENKLQMAQVVRQTYVPNVFLTQSMSKCCWWWPCHFPRRSLLRDPDMSRLLPIEAAGFSWDQVCSVVSMELFGSHGRVCLSTKLAKKGPCSVSSGFAAPDDLPCSTLPIFRALWSDSPTLSA